MVIVTFIIFICGVLFGIEILLSTKIKLKVIHLSYESIDKKLQNSYNIHSNKRKIKRGKIKMDRNIEILHTHTHTHTHTHRYFSKI